MEKVDYHIHTNLSDGVLSAEDIVIKSINNGCKSIAITDHDVASSYDDLALKYGISITSGIEFNTSIRNMHILGYGMSDIKKINDHMLKIRLENEKVCLEVINQMQKAGYDVSVELLVKFLKEHNLNTEILDKRKLVKYLMYKGYTSSVIETYDKLIGVGQKFYVPNVKLTPKEVIDLINETNGIAVLAHPNTLGLPLNDLQERLKYLQHIGLVGIEIINGRNTLPYIEGYSIIADNLSLVKTVGSDFHSPDKENIGISVNEVIPRTFEKVLELKKN